MGVGTPDDIVGAVLRGIDMFDCVIPTRAGRTARAYTRTGVLNLRNARHLDDAGPLDPECRCTGCTRHSRAYLHHLFRTGEMLGPMLLTQHNITYYQDLLRGLRDAIFRGGVARPRRRVAGALGGRRAEMTDLASLTQLGRPTALPASPDAAVLERVDNPAPASPYLVRFTAPEFTSLCPLTGQPDFAHIVIDYVPAVVDRGEQVV